MLIVEICTFGICLWLGLYLFRWEESSAAMKWVAGGLLSYGLAIALGTFGRLADGSWADILRLQVPVLLAPLACWSIAVWLLRDRLRSIGGGLRSAEDPRTAVGLILIATITFALGIGLIFLPFEIGWLPRSWLIIAISLDLLLLGYAIGVLDAFEAGEAFLPAFWRSLLEAETIAALFGLQIGLVIIFSTGPTLPMVILLFVVVGTALVLQTFARQIQERFDRLAFGTDSSLANERKSLREAADALPRQPAFATDPAEFAKQTRRALTDLNNLPKLAKSPLIHLPQVADALSTKQQPDHTLNRAAELQTLLIHAIEGLRPPGTAEFESIKSWRHYNALYFPYVRGLRPYSRPGDPSLLTEIDRSALEWIQVEVPPRTLYNWQSDAAKLISQQLLEEAETITE